MDKRIAPVVRVKRRLVALETIAMLAGARFIVRFVPFRYWKKLVEPAAAAASDGGTTTADSAQIRTAIRICRLTRRMSIKVPFEAVCLPQALASRWMLKRRNIPTQIVIGARRGTNGKSFDFHAWLMIRDLCILGEDQRSEFMEFEVP